MGVVGLGPCKLLKILILSSQNYEESWEEAGWKLTSEILRQEWRGERCSEAKLGEGGRF